MSCGAITRPSSWPPELLERLRELWNEGKTAAQIAVILSKEGGVERTKNAVLGMVHRMHLMKRASPIRRDPSKPGAPRRAVAPKAKPAPPEPKIASASPPLAVPPRAGEGEAPDQAPGVSPPNLPPLHEDDRARDEHARKALLGRAANLATPPVLTMPLRHIPAARYRTCQWPEGEVGTEGFRMCGEPTLLGKPYCAAHCARAYVPPKSKMRPA